MSGGPAHIRLVSADKVLPAYPAELCEAHASVDYFTAFWHDRHLNSRLHLRGDMDVQGAALNLFFLARKQVPVGSLPNDHSDLAKLLRIDLIYWHQLLGRPITPLHNWELYDAGGKVVLGHPVVIEVAMDAARRREARDLARTAKATEARTRRLGELMVEIGCDVRMTQDRVLMERLNSWVEENHKGQRRMPEIEGTIRAALRHAANCGWINRQR